VRVPALAPSDDMAGVFEPRAGVLAPERGVAAMLDAARAHGAAFWMDEPVTGWLETGGAVAVTSAARTVRARHVVLSAGAWLGELIGHRIAPLSLERVVQYWYRPAADGRFAPARLPVFLLEAPDGRVIYGLPDQGHGLKLAEHHGGRLVAGMNALDRDVGADEQARFHAFASTWVRGLDARPAAASVCVYTNTPDGDFILDRHPASPHASIVSACSGHGFKFAPAIGECLASEIAGERPAIDLTPFRLSRFAPPRT